MAIKTALCRGREAGAREGLHWVGPETCCNKIICCNKYLKIQLSETFSSRRGQQPTGHGIHQWILATTTATAGAATGAHGKEALCAAPEALCLALPRSGFTFFLFFAFPLFLSWHFHAVAAFCMRRVPTAVVVVVVVVFLVAAVLLFFGCGTSGGSDESLPSLCLYPSALILKAFKIFVRFRRHCSCLRRCPGHLF